MYFLFILAMLVKLSANKAPSRGDLRVYKGRNDAHNEFPFAVLLQLKDPPVRFCTGSLIAEDWVLTAAHCYPKTVPRLQSSVVPGHCHNMVIRYGDFTKPANETTLYSKRKKNTFFGLHVKYAGFGHLGKQYAATSKDFREFQLIPLQTGEAIVVPCKKGFFVDICIASKCSNRKQQVRPGDSGGPLVYDGRIIGVAKSMEFQQPISHYKPIFRMDSKHHTL
ncbi:uncharacterized protein LOC134743346 [Cydia strobilella]|uniref:uncharacterized protein LOC134743346 n=1 Tax=Cydia strobilella TaxID=1100964 RepID=UPI0030065E51